LPVETEKAEGPKQKRTDFSLSRYDFKKSLWHGRATVLIHSCGKTVGGFVFGGPRHNWRKHFPLERLQVFLLLFAMQLAHS
jgi:hypothetical protein